MKRSFIHILLCISLTSSIKLENLVRKENQDEYRLQSKMHPPKVSSIHSQPPGLLVIRAKLRLPEQSRKFSVIKTQSNGRGAERFDEYQDYDDEPPDDDDYNYTEIQPPEAGWSKIIYKNPGVYGAGWGTIRRDPNFLKNPLHILVPKSIKS